MDHEAIREAVRNRYGRIAAKAGEAEGAEESCCGPSCCGGTEETSSSTALGYDNEQLRQIPEGADLGLGSGNPVAIAHLREGETVLDLGSGGGVDSFLASEKVGPSGKVIGVDMTPEMVTLARANAKKGGYTNVDFRLGEIESLPVADATVDVIISNCVLNLSPERDRVLTEALRVLRPGGRLVISDLVSDVPVAAQLREDVEMVTACLPVERGDYEGQLRAAGFVDVMISAPEFAASVDSLAGSVHGAIIVGQKAG